MGIRAALIPVLFVCSNGWGQPAADSPTFEVASVRRLLPTARQEMVGVIGGPGTADPTRIEYRIPMTFLVMMAYGVTYRQVSGPDWLNTELYEIVAKIAPGTTKEQCSLMLQSLLAERFKLQIHRELQNLPMYFLTESKNGPKVKIHVDGVSPRVVADKTDFDNYPSLASGHLMASAGGHNHLRVEDRDLTWLAEELAAQLGSPVKDETGLTGKYDLELYWLSESFAAHASPGSGPDLSEALQGQLGLKLQEKEGPVETVVIDHVEKAPTEN